MQNQMKDSFEKDGYVYPVEVFSVEEADGLLKRYILNLCLDFDADGCLIKSSD